MSIPEFREMPNLTLEIPPSKTWRIDFEEKRLKPFLDGKEAVAQAAFLAIQTQRYQYLIFSWQYGSEVETLIGREADFVFSEGRRMIEEALSIDPRITSLRDFSFDKQVISFVMETIYGTKKMNVEVRKPT